MRDHFAATVKAFFSGVAGNGDGGFEIQFNVRSREEFERAKEDPEKYGDFLVRVSGYTAYFKDLNPQMQKEIMERTEYLLSSGNAQPSKPVVYLKAAAKNQWVNVARHLPGKCCTFLMRE